MTLEEIKESIEVIKAYRQMLTDSVSNQIDGDIEAFDVAIEAMEREPCEDAISRQAVLDLIEHYNSDGLGAVFYGYEEGEKFANAINKLPPVNPQRTGHWIAVENDEMETVGYYCSECDLPMETEYQTKFCPNCGAKMEVGNG